MGFLTGRATMLRFRPDGGPPGGFGPDHLDALDALAAGRQRIASADGVECGWAAGGHVLDTAFDLAKNVVADALVFDLRVDTDRFPPDLVKAYYETELKALSAGNPSGLPSARQKREAREAARDRLEEEAKDGRFKKRKCVPVLWDGPSGEVWFGATSLAHVDRMASLFRQTFGRTLTCLTAGPSAERLHGPHGSPPVAGAAPAPFVPGVTPDDVAWLPSAECRDFLGNEFLLWLWYLSDGEADTLTLADGSQTTFMFARRLLLDCPRGQTGADGFAHEGPTRLPEAKRAIQAGKLPRRAGLTLVRHDAQYELTLHAETMALASVKLPGAKDETARGRLEERVGCLRHPVETLDLMYQAFLSVRLSADWADELARVQRWLSRAERAIA